MKPFPLIVGCGRSGTTLVRSMCSAHSRLAIPYESHFIVPLGRPLARARYETGNVLDLEVFLTALFGQLGYQQWGLPPAEVRQYLQDRRPSGYPEGIRCVFELYARREGKERYGDKTPDYVTDITMLAELFPEARFIHVIRDGRDVASSWLDTEWQWGPQDAEEAALYWRYGVRKGRKAGEKLGPQRYLELCYEDLVAKPQEVLQGLCGFIDLEFEEHMLRYHEHAESVLGTMPRPRYHQRIRLPPTPGLRDWRRDMQEDDVRTFEGLAGELLAELGYETRWSAGASRRRAPAVSSRQPGQPGQPVTGTTTSR